jgi:competence protein ComEC
MSGSNKALALLALPAAAVFFMFVSLNRDINIVAAPDSETESLQHENNDPSFAIYFLDVGHGDAILIRTSSRNMLIDAGTRNSGIVSKLLEKQVDTLHLVIASHAHADHIGGLIEVLRMIPVLKVMDPGIPHTSALYRQYRFLVDSIQADYIAGRAGMTKQFCDDLTLMVLHPDTTTYDLNNGSLVVRALMNEVSALFTGDIETRAERRIIENFPELTSNILKVPHHGSRTSSHSEFLQWASPSMAVIQSGGRYNLPNQETLDALSERGITFLRTDEEGDVVVISDGKRFWVMEN